MKTEYTMLLHDIERKHGIREFNHYNEGYYLPTIRALYLSGYLQRVSMREWHITQRGTDYLEKVRAHFAQ